MTTITCEDAEKIDTLLDHNDHPLFVDSGEITEMFDLLSIVFWTKYSGDRSCSFCHEPAWHHNEQINMYACATCMLDLENGEVDVFQPDDHPVSLKLFNIIREWVDTNHWTSAQTAVYFDEYEITHNYCHVCQNTIENIPETYVAIATGGKAVAHSECATREGFRNCFTDYEDICEDLEIPDRIADLNSIPDYCPPISEEDSQKLSNLMRSHLPQLDYSGAVDLVQHYHQKYWIFVPSGRRCTFCPNSSPWYNEYLRSSACETCFTQTKDINPRTPH